jgi:hypothetical protein
MHRGLKATGGTLLGDGELTARNEGVAVEESVQLSSILQLQSQRPAFMPQLERIELVAHEVNPDFLHPLDLLGAAGAEGSHDVERLPDFEQVGHSADPAPSRAITPVPALLSIRRSSRRSLMVIFPPPSRARGHVLESRHPDIKTPKWQRFCRRIT